MISVSKRLQAIVDWIDGTILADIGCDHAYVAIEAIRQKKVLKAYACDIAQGPLNNAKKTIEELGLQDKIECVLMDGISGLSSEVDFVVIAGMGSKTIEMILDNGDCTNRTFLLMPHKDEDSLRKYCACHHLRIEKERMIHDGNHYYPLMKVSHDLKSTQSLNQAEIFYGKNMQKDQVFYDFMEKEQKKWSMIYQQMPEDKSDLTLQRLKAIQSLFKN